MYCLQEVHSLAGKTANKQITDQYHYYRRTKYEAVINITVWVVIVREVFTEEVIADWIVKSAWHLLDAYEIKTLVDQSILCCWELNE